MKKTILLVLCNMAKRKNIEHEREGQIKKLLATSSNEEKCRIWNARKAGQALRREAERL